MTGEKEKAKAKAKGHNRRRVSMWCGSRMELLMCVPSRRDMCNVTKILSASAVGPRDGDVVP
jgi:hypothetical protein